MKQKMPKNEHKEGDKIGEWKRIFKFLPCRTEDGYRVTFGHVWSRRVPTGLSWETLYHTNPDGKEDEYQRIHSDGYILGGFIPPPPPRMKTSMKKGGFPFPLTEGKMRRGNGPPPCGRGERPKAPPPPPRPTGLYRCFSPEEAGDLYIKVKELETQMEKIRSKGPGFK